MTDTVTKGWSKDESVTDTDSESSQISVTLPPYTAIMLSQEHSTEELVSRYNCPVALNYKATVYYVYEDARSDYACVHFKKIAEVGDEESGKPAVEDLADRFDDYKVANTADKELIRWKDMSSHCADAISIVSTTAPFDSTNAKFTEATEIVKSGIDSILPLKPIKYIRPVNVNDNSTLTNQQWDYDIDMDEGDSDYLSRIRLKAINDIGVEFSTFNQAKGHFIVVDENGKEDTSGSIVELVKVNGQNKYVAKGEGTAYLKYLINEDEYQTAEMAALSPDEYITNKDIEETGATAVIQVNVHHKHKLTRHAAKDPTCTEDGNIVYWTCTEGDYPCGKYFSDKNGENEIFKDEIVVKKTGHNWGEWKVTEKPTETREGHETRECLNGCGEVQTGSVPVTTHVHKLVRHAPSKPTCTEDGNIVYWTCTEGDHPCGKYFADKNGEDEMSEDETVVSATGHSWGEWKVTKEPTQKAAGEQQRVCSNDASHIEKEVIPAKGYAPGTDPKQKGTDGTAVGPGASAGSADKAITGMPGDKDPKGSVYNKLKLSSTKQTKTAITLKWTKPSKAKKFVLYGNRCGSRNKKLATFTGSSKKLTKVAGKKIKKGTYYKFILVALDKNNNVVSTSKVIHVATKGGKVTNPKKVTVKKGRKAITRVTVKKGRTVTVKNTVTMASKKLQFKTHRKVVYESSNEKIATVTSKGKIKGIRKGKCFIYAYTQNGVYTRIEVTVN